MSSPACLFDLPAPGEYQCPRCLEISPTKYMHENSRAKRPEIQKEKTS